MQARRTKKRTDCHDQSADWSRNDKFLDKRNLPGSVAAGEIFIRLR